MGPFTDAVSPV
ncbi:hypothetical protein Gpo141_00011624, partial [Globisporangium polare]